MHNVYNLVEIELQNICFTDLVLHIMDRQLSYIMVRLLRDHADEKSGL